MVPDRGVYRSSTLENWVREFDRFAPSISVQTYYGTKEERITLRYNLNNSQRKGNKDGWEVLITTYNLASGDDRDRKFFRKMQWDVRQFNSSQSCRRSLFDMVVLRV